MSKPKPNLHSQAIAKLDAYLAKTGMSERQLGIAVFKDHKLIQRIRDGRATLRSVARLEAAMEKGG